MTRPPVLEYGQREPDNDRAVRAAARASGREVGRLDIFEWVLRRVLIAATLVFLAAGLISLFSPSRFRSGVDDGDTWRVVVELRLTRGVLYLVCALLSILGVFLLRLRASLRR